VGIIVCYTRFEIRRDLKRVGKVMPTDWGRSILVGDAGSDSID